MMPETSTFPIENECEPVTTETEYDAAWEKDQKERGYYYDDAHGYEAFDPASDDEDDDLDELA